MNPRPLIILWLVWTALCVALLVFTIVLPAAWAALVDKENDYWLRRGWFSSRNIEKMKALEKGPAMKILLVGIILLSVIGVCALLQPSGRPHFKAMSPPATPVVRRPPPKH